MYSLNVSYDCGTTYTFEREAVSPEELKVRCDELDAEGLRWTVEDEKGKPVLHRPCAIHARIVTFMKHVNASRIPREEPDGA